MFFMFQTSKQKKLLDEKLKFKLMTEIKQV